MKCNPPYPIHVTPINDLYPHIEKGVHCQCVPEVREENGTPIVIHHAWDEREKYEQNGSIEWGEDTYGIVGNYYDRGNIL